jgi:hypothetical protein
VSAPAFDADDEAGENAAADRHRRNRILTFGDPVGGEDRL